METTRAPRITRIVCAVVVTAFLLAAFLLPHEDGVERPRVDHPTIVPNVIDLTESDAVRRLERAGLDVFSVYAVAQRRSVDGRVVRQEPDAGSIVERGTSVHVSTALLTCDSPGVRCARRDRDG